MAIGFSDPRYAYDGSDYYREQERRYRDEMTLKQMMSMQNPAYNPYMQMQQGVTDLEREQQPVKKPESFTSNKNLLLLEN
jgi:hypothetical protein